MTERTQFVYWAWDADGALLYIGCTKQPLVRWKQHLTERHAWTTYATSFRVAGPYVRQDAFDRERAAIRAERPAFNALPEQIAQMGRRHRCMLTQYQAAVGDLETDLGRLITFEEARPLHEQSEQYATDKYGPPQNDAWRLSQYLASKAVSAVAS